MGYMDLPNAQNNEIVWPIYLDSVTYKIAAIGMEGTNLAIATFLFDGVSLGTIDWYAGAGTGNSYKEITGVSITTPKAADLTMRAATKNASSSGYLLHTNSIAIIKTSGTSSTPAGTDTPGYTHELLGWMGTKTNTNFATRTQSSTELGGGRLVTDTTAQNNLFTYDMWKDTGSFTLALVHGKDTDQGIYNITGFNGTQTIDGYAAAASSNNYSTTTATGDTAAVVTVQVSMATKNASATAFGGKLNSIKWLRTGA